MTKTQVADVMRYLERQGCNFSDEGGQGYGDDEHETGEYIDSDGVRVNQHGAPIPPRMDFGEPAHLQRLRRLSRQEYQQRLNADSEIHADDLPAGTDHRQAAKALLANITAAVAAIPDAAFWLSFLPDFEKINAAVKTRLAYQPDSRVTTNDTDDDDTPPRPKQWMTERNAFSDRR